MPKPVTSLFPKPYADLVARLRVPTGFLLVAAFAWFSQPTTESVTIGFLCALPGLLLRAWAAGHLRKNSTLTTSGPYRFVRNPLYLGTLIVAMGLASATAQPWLALLFAAVFLLVYLPAVMLEEQHLQKLFPQFGAYAHRVPLFLPYCRPYPSHGYFSFAQYMHNREYEAALGFLAGVIFLLAKSQLAG
ncbi:MAG: isoprenylcysteine carboxylmethyltransferase family protein [Bryobacterales bacterium]|nr:isoprenylcysteine carboxylmethyltransferase family protein [Bryobacterales bacterium]